MQKVFVVLLIVAATCSLAGCGGRQDGSYLSSVSNSHHLISVRLAGANEAATAEIFGKIVSSAEGVRAAKRYATRIVPDNPQECSISWRVSTVDGDGFVLQTAIMDMVREVIWAEGYLTLNGVSYSYSMSEIEMLYGLRPAESTSREISFVIDRELARDRRLSGG